MSRLIFITVAEVSGDQHAAKLIASLRRIDATIEIEGHGGPAMARAGAKIHRETVGGAAMGLGGAFRAREIYRMLRWTRRYFDEKKPDLQVCIDSSAMNLHFAKAARERGIPVLYYVAPQLWAWREGRMKKLRAAVDRLACILPFEEQYFRAHDVPATFVGHPLFDELPQCPTWVTRSVEEIAGGPMIGLLAGSRKGEAENNFPRMLAVAERILRVFPAARFLCPTTDATHPIVQRLIADWTSTSESNSQSYKSRAQSISLEKGAFDRVVPQCDLCITVSGTATLHVAGLGTPMIVVYRASPLLWHGLGRWLMKTRTFALVNVLAGGVAPNARSAPRNHIVPEFIPWLGAPDAVADTAIEMLRDPSQLAAQRQRLRELVTTLDRPGASDRVAALAIAMMNERAAGGGAGVKP